MVLYLGDCLEVMKEIPNESVDMILTDLPYNTTNLRWDYLIDLKRLWFHYKRIIKPTSSIVLFAVQPFTTTLISSNPEMYKYSWIWKKDKSKTTSYRHAANYPMKITEDILVFSKGSIAHKNNPKRMTYNPQNLIVLNKEVKGTDKGGSRNEHNLVRPSHQERYIRKFTNYPTNILEFSSDYPQLHPTQKPVALLEYLIRTYTEEGGTVLDSCMGSGSTIIAAINTNRKYIGIELDSGYYEIAEKRVSGISSRLST